MKTDMFFTKSDLVTIIRNYVQNRHNLGAYNTPITFNVLVSGQEYEDVDVVAEVHIES